MVLFFCRILPLIDHFGHIHLQLLNDEVQKKNQTIGGVRVAGSGPVLTHMHPQMGKITIKICSRLTLESYFKYVLDILEGEIQIIL